MKKISIALLFASQICMAQQRPNIIHIIADDIGWDDFSTYGSPYYQTPHIDRLARNGIRLTNFYAPHSTCTPTRAALLTGRYAPRVNNNTGLGVLFPTDTIGLDPKKEISFTQLLKENGYATALFGKWHLGHLPRYLPAAHGFEEFLGIPYPNDHGPERLGNTGSRGFPPIPLIHNTTKVKDLTNQELAELPQTFVREACRYITEKVKRKEPFYLQYSNIETHTPWFLPSGFSGSPIGAYGDAVAYFDRSVGILMDLVRQLGIEENTLIVLQSDNGPLVERYEELERCYGIFASVDTTRVHLLRQGKYQDRYEGGQRVACIVQWKGKIPEGKSTDALLTGVDWFPSFLNIAQVPLPDKLLLDGKNLMPLLMNKNSQPLRNTYYSFTSHAGPAAVRVENWKLVRPNQPTAGWELYDLLSDPGEKNNLSAEKKELTEELKRLLETGTNAVKTNTSLADWNTLKK